MDIKIKKNKYPFRSLTEKMIASICLDIKEGSTFRLAALSNGIARSTLEQWRQQGEFELAHGITDTLTAQLVCRLAISMKEDVKIHVENLLSDRRGHRGSEFLLDRLYWQDFSNHAAIKALNDKIEILLDEKKSGSDINVKSFLNEAKKLTEL
jgi:hypothetical protein